jgi:DNA polymerase alpha-associated DNA helicase A
MVACSVTTESQFSSFIGRHRILLAKERDAEVERSSLLLSNCGPKLLERKGLALLGLGIIGVNIGLEGKTSASCLLQHRQII